MTRRTLPWRADPVAGQLAGWMVLFFPAALIMGVVAWLLTRSEPEASVAPPELTNVGSAQRSRPHHFRA